MEELQVNDYIRTGSGRIDKVIRERFMGDYVEGEDGIYLRESVKRHSKNLIDLIELGDFVNGREVMEFDYEDGTMLGFPIYTSDGLFNTIECYVPLEQFDIVEILTHELYEKNCYEV